MEYMSLFLLSLIPAMTYSVTLPDMKYSRDQYAEDVPRTDDFEYVLVAAQSYLLAKRAAEMPPRAMNQEQSYYSDYPPVWPSIESNIQPPAAEEDDGGRPISFVPIPPEKPVRPPPPVEHGSTQA